jgi:DNA-binding GntR family transcriptional regulator
MRLDAIRVTVFAYIPQRSRLAIREHEAIIQAIEQGARFDKIERLAREHKLNTMRAYIDHGARTAPIG